MLRSTWREAAAPSRWARAGAGKSGGINWQNIEHHPPGRAHARDRETLNEFQTLSELLRICLPWCFPSLLPALLLSFLAQLDFRQKFP